MTDKFKHYVTIPSRTFTDRANHLPMEGGALNAGYTPVDALCHISNILGHHGLVYNEDWWWESFDRSRPVLPAVYTGDDRRRNTGGAAAMDERKFDYNVRLRFKNKESIAFLKLHEMFKNLKEMKNDNFRC